MLFSSVLRMRACIGLLLIFFAVSAVARLEPLTGDAIPLNAQAVDLLSPESSAGRGLDGDQLIKTASLEQHPRRHGQLFVDSTPRSIALAGLTHSIVFEIEADRSVSVVELAVFRGEHALGSVLFSLDGQPRSGTFAAQQNRIGGNSLQAFDRVELRNAQARSASSGFTMTTAWLSPEEDNGRDGSRDLRPNEAALLCQTPLGITYNLAFGASLVPGAGLLASGAAYASNLALKYCLTYVEPPASREIRVPAGQCSVEFEQKRMRHAYENALGIIVDYESDWGDLGAPFVYHHNTEVDVVLLYNNPSPPISSNFDLEFWAESGSFEATDRIWEECNDDGTVATSQLDGEGPVYQCPYVEGRVLDIPVGERDLRWLVTARMSPLDLFPVPTPGLPSGAKLQPWSGLLVNVIAESLLITSDFFFDGWRIDNRRNEFQRITIFDEIPPTITPQPFSDGRITAVQAGDVIEVTIEADEAGGVSARRYINALKSMYQVSDACDRPTAFSASYANEALRSFWPVSTTAQNEQFTITWTARDPGPNLDRERNETIVTMRVEVVDTQPPTIVPPDDIVEVDTGVVSELGQPLVFDFVDLSPNVSNDASLPIGLGLTEVTWTVTDASGNTDSAVQIVNVKNSNLDPSPIAQTGANRVDAVSFEPTPIRLRGSDPDGDPLRFFIDQAPDEGFFVAPLYPYFVEDFRTEQNLTDPEVLAICTNGQGNDRNFDLEFPSEPEYLTTTDDGRSFVADRGLIDCRAGSPVSFRRLGRIAVFDTDGSLLASRQESVDDLEDMIVEDTRDRIYYTTQSGSNNTTVRVFNIALDEVVIFNLTDLRERQSGACLTIYPGDNCNFKQGVSAIVDENDVLYVMRTNGFVAAFDATLPPGFDCDVDCSHTPTWIGNMLDDGPARPGDGNAFELDVQGRLYASIRSRVYRFNPSFIEEDTQLNFPGELEGWLGRCDIDLAPGDQAVCDVANRRSLGYSCTDEVCLVDTTFNPDEEQQCPAGTNLGNIIAVRGCRPGQFRGARGIDIDPNGTLYVADSGNLRIQRFSEDGFFAGQAVSSCDGGCFVLGDFGNPQDVAVNSNRFYVLDPQTNLLHISLLTPFVEIGPDYADLEYQSRNQFACNNPDNCIDTFSFRVSDGVRDPATGRPIRSTPTDVEIGVVRNFRPPFATPGIAHVLPEDVPTAILLDGSDPDPLDSLSFQIDAAPEHGTVVINGNQALYTPDPDFFGSDSFSFTAFDGSERSAAELVLLTVAEVNDAPTVQVPDPVTVGVGFTYALDLEFDDPDPNEQHLLVIDWGDGTIESEGELLDNGQITGPLVSQLASGGGKINAEHIYSSAGNYTVEVCMTDRVTGDDGSEVPTPGLSLTGCNPFPVNAINGLDLVMSATASTERALPNQLISVRFTALNNPPTAGPPGTATGVELIAELPEGLTPGSITLSGSGCSLNELEVVCDIGTLNPGVNGGVEITARVDGASLPGTALVFQASATLDQVDVSPNNDSVKVISVSQPADLYLDTGEQAFRDKPDINPGDGQCASADNVCTLRAAIEEANAQAGTQVIALGTGVYGLTEGQLRITDDLILIGNGASRSLIFGEGINTSSIVIQDANVTLRLEDMTVAQGTVSANPGDLIVRRARFTGTTTSNFFGGALFLSNFFDIRDSTFDNNRSIDGAAIWSNPNGSGVLENVTITGNTGGGLALRGTNYSLNHVTITGNGGGTFLSQGGALNLLEGANASITGSILAGNYSVGGPVNCLVEGGGALISGGDNLLGDLAGCGLTLNPTDLLVEDTEPLVQPTNFSEAEIPFAAPRANSPAVDNMLGPNCPATDARGVERPVDGDNDGFSDCDIGAVELVPELSPPRASLSSASLDFGDIEPGNSSPAASIQITNGGQQTLAIQSISLIDNPTGEFELVSDACSNQSLVEAASCSIQLRFTPAGAGVKTARLQIDSNDPEGMKTITLRGSSDVLFTDGFENVVRQRDDS